MLRFIRLLLNAVDFFCVYSFIVRYNSLNSFLSFPHLSLPLSRRRQRNSLLLGGKILQKQKNRQQDFFCCCCSFPLGFYCAIETDLHAFNFYLVTSSLHLPVPLLCCSLPVYYYYFVVRPGFFSSLHSLSQSQELPLTAIIKAINFHFTFVPSTIDSFSMNSNTLLFCQIVPN